MKEYKVKPEYQDAWFGGLSTDEIGDAIVTKEEIERLAREWDMSVEELMDQVEEVENEEIVLKISRIAIKSETFCTPWNGHLYCVDITEDAKNRGAWLYRSDMGVKSFMFGYMLKDMDADKFKDLVFSNLPDYIEDYEEEYGA